MSFLSTRAQPQLAGDTEFAGVVDRGQPDALQPGYVSAASNMSFGDGAIRTRGGIRTPSFQYGSRGTVYGSGLFSDPNGVEWILAAGASTVERMRDGRNVTAIDIPDTITGRVAIVQGFDEVLLFRGEGMTPWRWSGQDGDAFEAVSQEEAGDGTTVIPSGPDFTRRPGLHPVVVNSRLIVPHGRNGIAISDIEDYTRYDAAYNDFNLSAANDDTLAALVPMGQSGLLALKDGSAALLTGISSSLTSLSLSSVSGAPGCIAGQTARAVGGGVLYLSTRGVYAISAEFENRLAASDVAVSEPIRKIIERINWRYANAAVAAVHDERYYLAVPLDDSTTNNVILPFNLRTKAWEGIHDFPSGVQFQNLIVSDYQSARRLFGVSTGFVHLLYEGRCDLVTQAATRYDIRSSVTTRAYSFESLEKKTVRRAKVNVLGWYPVFTVTVNTNSALDTHAATTFTPSQSAYKTFGVADYDVTNADADHATRGREDYAVTPPLNLEESGTLGVIYQGPYSGTTIVVQLADANMTPLQVGDKALIDGGDNTDVQTITAIASAGSGLVQYTVTPAKTYADGDDISYRRDVSNDNGIDFDIEQAHQLAAIVRTVGTSAQLSISSSRGTFVLESVAIEGTPAERKDTRK
jgi:hypothetical protein